MTVGATGAVSVHTRDAVDRAGERAGARDRERPTEHPIHPSLVRPVLYLGVERPVIGLEATLCFALVLGAGPSLATLGVAAVVMLVVHPVMAWLTAKDPLATEVAVRSRAYADFYAPHAALRGHQPRPRPSLPVVR